MNNSGITNFNVLNTNFLYIQGIRVDFGETSAFLQGEIDAIEQQIVVINNTVNRIDFNQAPALVGDLVITEDNKNSVLLTAIQNINTQIAKLNQFDLTGLPVPQTCIITTATTNQALKGLIDTNSSDITTIQGQITTINGQITTINTKIAHWNNFTFGSDSMCGVNDGTGFAVALSGGSASGNGIFVYPNTTSVGSQIQIISAYDKDVLIRGGNQLGLYGGNDGSMLNVNVVDIGDKTDKIRIGMNHSATEYAKVQIGVDSSIVPPLRASDTNIQGDVRISAFNALLPSNLAPYTPVVYADTTPGVKNGNINNITSDPTFSGLDVIGLGLAPITLTALTGLILINSLAGGVTVNTGVGAVAFNCGAGGFSIATGAGILNLATGAGNIEMSTLSGNISIGAGKGLGGSAGNTILNAKQVIEINPDIETDIYKTAFVEFNENASAPGTTANRLYQQANQLYFDGAPLGGGGGNQYVLKAGDTMTGALTLPEGITSILTLNNLTTAPSPVTNRLYLLNNVLTFNGVAVGGGGGAFVPLAGNATMTGSLSLNYDAGANAQLNIVNTNTVAGTGGAINIRNDSAGAGSIGERCGKIDFSGRDSASAGGRTYSAIQAYINDPTSGAIDGRLSSFVASNNTLTEMFRLVSTSTSVRQANIGATYTTIGSTAIGSNATSTLTVQGTTNSTTSLQTPEIFNCPAIFPATSATLVDGAVKQYRPERIYKLNDYPNPLGAPSIDGEKVIILNSGGNPTNTVDSILQSSDFPNINGATFVKILQSKYVNATASTPAMNVITAVYNEPNQRIHMFVQPDVAGVLALTRVATLYFGQGQALVNDFCVTTFQSKTRIYAGGQFDTVDTAPPYASTSSAVNFSGQIAISWSAGAITNIVCNLMTSNATTQDGQGAIWGGVNGVNDNIRCVIDATGYSGLPQPPTTGLAKYDSIVIGGEFFGIGSGGGTSNRALRRMAYYDWFNGNGTTISLVNQPPPITFSQQIGNLDLTAEFSVASANQYNITADQMAYYTNGATYSASFGIYLFNGNTQSSSLISALFPFTIDTDNTTNKTFTSGFLSLTPQPAGWYYYIGCNTGSSALDVFVGLQNNTTNARCCVATAVQAGEPVGWRAFQDDSWATPYGADGDIVGGALMSSGSLVFAYNATTVTTPTGSLASNYVFTLQYNSGFTSFGNIGSDDQAIQTGQAWNNGNFERNIVTGGNPVLAFGAGNAIAYSEVYLNTGSTNAGGTLGVSYRTSSIDPYEMTDSLVLNSSLGISTDQLKPQFGSQACYAVYRDDTKYNGVFFIARGNELATATLPFTGGVPNYSSISYNSQPIACYTFGGYSSEIGYQGALFATNTNLFLYKQSSAGELVIELSGVVVRTFNDTNPASPIIATNKLTFPTNTDGGSVTLCGDTSTSPYSWWAISQDGSLYYDNTLIGGSGAGTVSSVTGSGDGISVSPTSGAVVVMNTGVTSIVAGTNISLSSTGSGGTGAVTINATSTPASNGWIKMRCPLLNINNTINNAVTFLTTAPGLDFGATWKTGLGVNFDVGGGGTQLRYTGTGWVTATLTFDVGVSIYSTASSDWINLLHYSNDKYRLSNFGLRIQVVDANGNQTQYNPDTYGWFLGASNTLYVGTGIVTSSPPLYENTLVYSCLLTTNSYINVQYMCNQVFNQSGGGHQAGDLSATFFPSIWTVTIQETGAPDHQ
jgi:hypothetical protein